MQSLVPLAVAVPLLAAAVFTVVGRFLPPRVVDGLAVAVAASTAVLTGILLVRAWGGSVVYWFGGWQPRGGLAIGIDFVVDPIGAGLACFAALVVTGSLVFSWHYFDEVLPLYHALVLVFLGAMVGFSLTGDLFNLFVFFELMGVVAYALTAHAHTELAPLQGGLVFAITNSIAGFLVLLGIALLYGHTGTLNLAQLGRALDREQPGGLLVLSFALLAAGFLVKAAAVPFHFWLADAYAVAPTPVCALFSAVMSDLGLYALARVYWTVFSGPFGSSASAVRGVLLGVACLTMVLGGLMAFMQRHLKRLLAFATISRGGLFLAGIALLTPVGLGGACTAVVGEGFVKAALFLGVGVLVRVRGSGDELRLRGEGRGLPLVGATFLVGALVVGGLVPTASFAHGWLVAVVVCSAALVAGGLLRATGRIFLGLGGDQDPLLSPEADRPERDEPQDGGRAPTLAMMGSMLALLVAGLAVGFAPHLRERADQGAARLQDHVAYERLVLDGARAAGTPVEPASLTWTHVLEGVVAVGAGAALAYAGLRRRRRWAGALRDVLEPVRALHSGHVGDYVAWLVAGTAALAVLFAVTTKT
jgi:multicomponent Na+:H+ antiporter subunit D